MEAIYTSSWVANKLLNEVTLSWCDFSKWFLLSRYHSIGLNSYSTSSFLNFFVFLYCHKTSIVGILFYEARHLFIEQRQNKWATLWIKNDRLYETQYLRSNRHVSEIEGESESCNEESITCPSERARFCLLPVRCFAWVLKNLLAQKKVNRCSSMVKMNEVNENSPYFVKARERQSSVTTICTKHLSISLLYLSLPT